jgi:hypothetical protein
VISNFCTVIFELDKQVENPDVVRVPARTVAGRFSNNKERDEKVASCRNMMPIATEAPKWLMFFPPPK